MPDSIVNESSRLFLYGLPIAHCQLNKHARNFFCQLPIAYCQLVNVGNKFSVMQ